LPLRYDLPQVWIWNVTRERPMIEEPPLLRIKQNLRRPTDAQIAAFQGVPTGFVVDAMFGRGAMASVISPISDGRDMVCKVAGPALTADAGAGDVLAVLATFPSVRDGDVIVSAFGGYQGCAAAGDRVCGMLKNNGAAGFVTDGPMRDYDGIVGVGLPAWCTGLTPGSPHTKGPGTVGYPIQVGGPQVETGDMIIADRDGVVVVPFDQIDAVIAMLDTVATLEHDLDAEVAEGLRLPDAIRDLLESDKVTYEP
jgi:4-hydroxy-4-methyl-2-oxoglutarate aldolase